MGKCPEHGRDSSNKRPAVPIPKQMAPVKREWGSVKRKWTRIQRKEDIDNQVGWSSQEKAEESAARDLDKPIDQLLSDIHEGHQKRKSYLAKNTTAEEGDAAALVLETLKRTASMMARVAKENIKTQRRMFWMTCAILALTVVLCWIGCRKAHHAGAPSQPPAATGIRTPTH